MENSILKTRTPGSSVSVQIPSRCLKV